MQERTTTFEFKDGALKGREVTLRTSLSIDEILELQALIDGLQKKRAGLKEIRALLYRVAELGLRGWNFTDDNGEPLPATPDSLTGVLPFGEAQQLAYTYIGGLGVVPGPLGRRFENGTSSDEPPASTSPES